MKKLKSILLVDDNNATNLLHRKIIERFDAADQIHVARTGEEALDFLAECYFKVDKQECPELIFVDINMPRMDGWEFLAEYRKRNYMQKPSVICMLSGSLNEHDQSRALALEEVSDYYEKPLSRDSFTEFREKYFSEGELPQND